MFFWPCYQKYTEKARNRLSKVVQSYAYMQKSDCHIYPYVQFLQRYAQICVTCGKSFRGSPREFPSKLWFTKKKSSFSRGYTLYSEIYKISMGVTIACGCSISPHMNSIHHYGTIFPEDFLHLGLTFMSILFSPDFSHVSLWRLTPFPDSAGPERSMRKFSKIKQHILFLQETCRKWMEICKNNLKTRQDFWQVQATAHSRLARSWPF